MNKSVENIKKVLSWQTPSEIPVAIFGGSPFNMALSKISGYEYYNNSQAKLAAFTNMFEALPDVMFLPGIWPDFGPVDLISAFGCEIVYPDKSSPYAKTWIKEASDIDKIKPVNPHKDGLMPKILAEWEYLWKHLDRKWIDEYGYLDGVGLVCGPVETSAILRGYQDFLIDIMDEPEKMHKLLRIVTETIIDFLKVQEKINGRLKRLVLIDHVASIISRDNFDEFFAPYTKAIFDEFNYTEIRMWHNEGKCAHLFDKIPRLGCNLWQYGEDNGAEARKKLDNKVCLMGPLNPVSILRNSVEQVAENVKDVLKTVGSDGLFILSAGGGLAPGTPLEKINLIIKNAREFEFKGKNSSLA